LRTDGQHQALGLHTWINGFFFPLQTNPHLEGGCTMKPHNEEQKVPESRNKPAKPRFRIEKLEERIAPAKGGTHCTTGSYGSVWCKHGHIRYWQI
jgi:hypothetical protein